MTGEMSIEAYLAQGGILSSPENAPPRYRAELLRLMASFVDSTLAGAAGFADTINDAPGLTERIAACRIVLEKTDHARKVLRIMADFGADTARYATHQPWQARVPRDSDLGAARHGGDMRLSVFHYPLTGWADAVVMNTLMGRASVLQLTDYARLSYQPLAEVFREILPVETRHAELGEEGLARLSADPDTLQPSIAYWWPRVDQSFGPAASPRFATLQAFGLRHDDNETLRARWQTDAAQRLTALGLTPPA